MPGAAASGSAWVGELVVPVSARSPPMAYVGSAPAACRATVSSEVVVVFPEGQLSRNGLTGPFHRGVEVIVGRRDGVPVVPVSSDELPELRSLHSDAQVLDVLTTVCEAMEATRPAAARAPIAVGF